MATYILNDKGEPVHEPDIIKWARWVEKADRVIERTEIGSVQVSTCFFGIDHNFGGGLLPALWETCVFGAPDGSQYMDRYTSRADAVEGHERVVEAMRQLLERSGAPP